MLSKINKSFEFFEDQRIFSIHKVEWWLLKYYDLYKETHDLIYSQHLFRLEDGQIARLPPTIEPTNEDRFLALYEALDQITEYHKYEDHFEQEMVLFRSIEHSKMELKKWLTKNEIFVSDKFACFIIDYLDYDENGQEDHLNIFVPNFKELELFIERKYFKNIIDLLEVYNK